MTDTTEIHSWLTFDEQTTGWPEKVEMFAAVNAI